MITLLHDWVLVRMDPLPDKIGSIIVPQGAAGAERVRTGVVVRTGPGRRTKDGRGRIPVGVEPGEQVAFFRENLEHQQGKQITRRLQELDADMGLIRSLDILYAGSW